MNDPTYEPSLGRYWKLEVDPYRRCVGIAPDVVCDGTKVRPFVGSAAPVVIVLAQVPTLRARPSTNVAVEMDDNMNRAYKPLFFPRVAYDIGAPVMGGVWR